VNPSIGYRYNGTVLVDEGGTCTTDGYFEEEVGKEKKRVMRPDRVQKAKPRIRSRIERTVICAPLFYDCGPVEQRQHTETSLLLYSPSSSG